MVLTADSNLPGLNDYDKYSGESSVSAYTLFPESMYIFLNNLTKHDVYFNWSTLPILSVVCTTFYLGLTDKRTRKVGNQYT